LISTCLTAPLAAGEVRGVISKVNLDQKELLLEGRGRGVRGLTLTIYFTADTRFEAGRKSAQAADLSPGKHVRVLFEMRDGKQVATLVSWPGLLAATPATPVAPADPNTVVGKLVRVGWADREITVIGPGEKETTLPVAEDVTASRDKNPILFEDLKEGEQVVVKFEKKGDKQVAKAISVGPPAGGGEENRGEKVRDIMKLIEGILQQMRDKRP
jgi:hypothetical protein